MGVPERPWQYNQSFLNVRDNPALASLFEAKFVYYHGSLEEKKKPKELERAESHHPANLWGKP